MSKIDELLNKLEKVSRNGQNKWRACCPAHADKTPSLNIRLADDDRILIHCFGGCAPHEIIGAIGLTLADLMPEKPRGYSRERARLPRFSKSEMFDRLLHEATILMLAVRKLKAGQPLTDTDIARVVQAETVIDNLRLEAAR
jgi:hypothetical protein